MVKSSDSILGPFEFDRVVESIFKGDIHLLDEIKGPFERWRPIKDHSLFAAAIERLKASTYKERESTMTHTLDIGTRTDITQTQTLSTNIQTDSGTPVIREESRQSVPTAPDSVLPDPPSQQPVPQVSSRSSSALVFLVSFLGLIIGGASFLIYDYKKNQRVENQVSQFDFLSKQAMQALKVGDYQEALQKFKLANAIAPQEPNLLVEMAPLSLQFEGQFSQVQLSIEKILAGSMAKLFVKPGNNIIGLTLSYQGKPNEAIKAYDEVLAVDDQYFPSLINKAFSLIKAGEAEQAVLEMRKVVNRFPGQAIAHYLYIRSLVENGLKRGDKQFFSEAISVARQFPERFFDFRQEVLFLVAYSQLRMGAEPEVLNEAVESFLAVDVELTNLHVHDTQIDFQSFNWIDFGPFCDQLKQGISEYHAQLLSGFCLLKVNQAVEAKVIFNKLQSQKVEDGLLQGLYVSSLFRLNEVTEAKNSLMVLGQVEEKKPMAEASLRGCLEAKDSVCYQAIFQGPHAKHLSILYSHWGNSLLQKNKNPAQAKTSVELGLEISPNFAPLLKIKERL